MYLFELFSTLGLGLGLRVRVRVRVRLVYDVSIRNIFCIRARVWVRVSV